MERNPDVSVGLPLGEVQMAREHLGCSWGAAQAFTAPAAGTVLKPHLQPGRCQKSLIQPLFSSHMS